MILSIDTKIVKFNILHIKTTENTDRIYVI